MLQLLFYGKSFTSEQSVYNHGTGVMRFKI